MTAKTTSKSPSKVSRRAQRRAARTPPPGWQDPLARQQPLVSGAWLVRAVLVVVVFAAVSAYLTLCLLFYQGQWQVVFHPTRGVATTPAHVGIKYDEVRFDYTGTGQAQLAGWWIPSQTNPARTLLFLHDGKGSLADVVPRLKALHSLGVNIFAFDYRGFGNSIDTHPSEQRVYEDADAAWTYLTDIRHIDPKTIVIYGSGLGATIAAEAALRHRDLPAVILENPAPPALSLIEADSRTSLLPSKWLFRDRFEIAPKLHGLGIELSQQTAQLVATGKPALAPVIVRQDTPQHLKLLLLLGDAAPEDPGYTREIAAFVNSTE